MNKENPTSREEIRTDTPTSGSETTDKIMDILGGVITEGAATGAITSDDVKIIEEIGKEIENHQK